MKLKAAKLEGLLDYIVEGITYLQTQEVATASELNAKFASEFVAARRPALLRGASGGLCKWSVAALLVEFAGRRWHINAWEREGCDVELTLASFVAYMDSQVRSLFLSRSQRRRPFARCCLAGGC